MNTSSSMGELWEHQLSAPRVHVGAGRGRGRRRRLAGAVHLAASRKYGISGIDLADRLPAPPGMFLIERLLFTDRTELGDVHGLEELVIVSSHEAFAAVEHGSLHAFE